MRISTLTLQHPLNEREQDALVTRIVQWGGVLYEVGEIDVKPEPPDVVVDSRYTSQHTEVQTLKPAIRLLELGIIGPLADDVDSLEWHRTPFNILGRIYLTTDIDYVSSSLGDRYRVVFREVA